MSKWMNVLLEEIEKNKDHAIQPIPALSGTSEGVPVKFGGIKNIGKDAYIAADKADSCRIAVEKLVGISSPFSHAIEIIRNRNKPEQISGARWTAIVHRLNGLIHDERHHLLKMIEYGWPLPELFGCHKFAPDARIDGMGLLMLIASSTLAEITRDKALLRSKRGSITSYSLGVINRNPSECSTLMEIE